MITVNNYTDKANSINWSKLPKALQDTKEDIDFSIELYDDLDKGSKDVIDLFLKQLNKNLSNTEAKKPAAQKTKSKAKPKPKTTAKKSNVKSYIVVSTKNGEGYSDPVVKYFNTKEKAVDFLDKEVSDYEKAGFEFVDTKNHITHLSNGEDDASIHILMSGKVFNLIEIKPDTNKVKIIHSSDDYISLVEKLKKEVKSKSFDMDDVEEFFSDDNDEDYFGSHDEDTGDYIHYDITGGYDKTSETKKPANKKSAKFKIGDKVSVKKKYLNEEPTFKFNNKGEVKQFRGDNNEFVLVTADQDKGDNLFHEDELVKYKPTKTKKKQATKKESPCDDAIKNFLEDQKEDREKAAAKRKRNKVKNALDEETVNFYNAEFRLLRRFYNLVSKKTKVSFRSVQLLYMAFQKNAVARKVRKTSDLANLYNICNKKLTKLYEAIAPEKADVKITFKDKDVLEQLATLVKNKKVDYSISLINRIINMQGTAPEDAKVKRLISSIDNAIKKGKIDERSRLFDDIKKGKSTLKAYLEDKTEKIPTKQYGLSKPNIQKKKSKKKGLGNPKPKTIEVDLSQVPDPTPKALGNPYTEVQPQPQTEALHLERSKPQSVNTQKEVVKTDAALQKENTTIDKTQKGVINSSQLMNMSFETIELTGEWADFMQDPAKNMKIGIIGRPKNGKTAGSTALANELTKHGNVLYNFTDQGLNKSTQKLWELSGLSQKSNAFLTDTRDLDELENLCKTGNYDYVFIDMINNYIHSTGIKYHEFESRFIKKYKDISFILVFEATKTGDFKGDQGWTHILDQLINVEDFVMESKGRYGVGEYVVWKEGLQKTNPKKYKEFFEEEEIKLPQSIEVSLS